MKRTPTAEVSALSEIRTMNKGLAWKLGIAAVVAAGLVVLSISPRLVIELSTDLRDEGSDARLLLSTIPVPLAWIAVVLFRWGRNSPHRTAVNRAIVTGIAEEMCSVPDCPQQSEPSSQFTDAASAIFYKKIDSHSREVAFEYWENYFVVRGAFRLASVALVVSLLGYLVFPTTEQLPVRLIATAILVLTMWVLSRLEEKWEVRTLRHARQQVLQIADELPNSLRGASCEHPNCVIARP